MLFRVAAGLGVEFAVSVRKPTLVTRRALAKKVVGELHTDRADVFVAAA